MNRLILIGFLLAGNLFANDLIYQKKYIVIANSNIDKQMIIKPKYKGKLVKKWKNSKKYGLYY